MEPAKQNLSPLARELQEQAVSASAHPACRHFLEQLVQEMPAPASVSILEQLVQEIPVSKGRRKIDASARCWLEKIPSSPETPLVSLRGRVEAVISN